ncbi:hypothetical protein OG322_40395 [Streptomyces sp. NBC_01260]|uniref:hypothetical protein n=1 Tax=unclassified Streptomyces TaxID=2593676 RepID=UPI000FBE6865|nr:MULTISPECIES: hypothetical protein [unclassified Streptomyces]MCX4774948.1 hypothetical protein [Streptomyces sp. NBC_01285]ROQ78392.1 hypothetical protein EDD95_5035 [Streptomyces sp. CEV 2-1]
MYRKLEAVGSSLLARFVPKAEASAASCGPVCTGGWWWWCCVGSGCTSRSESRC